MSDVALIVNGAEYRGWMTVGLTRAMDAVASSFTFSLSERWGDGAEPFPIDPGAAAEIRVDGKPVLLGWVDSVAPSFSESSHTISISGRSKSGDLVDCAAVHTPDQWTKIRLEQLVRNVAAPFGITNIADESGGRVIDVAKVQVGETAWEFIERIARKEALLVNDDYRGGLVIREPTKAARADVALVQGVNIVSAEGKKDWSGRFSEYQVRAQTVGFDFLGAEGAALIDGRASDQNLSRYRPRVVIAESASDATQAAKRAGYEMTVAAGKSQGASITVPGWYQDPSASTPRLWEPNLLVSIDSPWLRMDGRDMLIVRVAFEKGEGGERTTLDVAPIESFRVLPKLKAAGPNWSALLKDLGFKK